MMNLIIMIFYYFAPELNKILRLVEICYTLELSNLNMLRVDLL